MKKIMAMMLLGMILLTGCASNSDGGQTGVKTASKSKSKKLTFGSTFEFNGLEITIGSEFEFEILENTYSDLDGADVIVLPVTITNLTDETHGLSSIDYTLFGSRGSELESISYYFEDDVNDSGKLRSGATVQSAFHILYDGDGDYYIEFDDWMADKIFEVKLPIAEA